MKNITLSLLVLTTLLTIGMVTLFTACPKPEVETKPEPTKSGGNPKPEADDKADKPAGTTKPEKPSPPTGGKETPTLTSKQLSNSRNNGHCTIYTDGDRSSLRDRGYLYPTNGLG